MTSSTYLGIAESIARRDRLPNGDIAPFVLWLAPQLGNPAFDWAVVDRWLGTAHGIRLGSKGGTQACAAGNHEDYAPIRGSALL